MNELQFESIIDKGRHKGLSVYNSIKKDGGASLIEYVLKSQKYTLNQDILKMLYNAKRLNTSCLDVFNIYDFIPFM